MRVLLSRPLAPAVGNAQASHGYQADFSREELAARRARVLDAIGPQGIAVVQGATGVPGFSVFRQSNDFYYLTGVESEHAYLLLHGRTRRSTLYLPHRDEARERGQGKVLSVEDSLLLAQLTGIDQVRGLESLSQDLTSADLLRLMNEGVIPENKWERDFYELALKVSGAVQAMVPDETGLVYVRRPA